MHVEGKFIMNAHALWPVIFDSFYCFLILQLMTC